MSFELFARPALLDDDGPHRAVPARWSPPAPSTRFARKLDGKLHLDRVVVDVDDGRYVVAERAARRRATRSRRRRGRRARAPPRRRRRRRRRRRARDVVRLNDRQTSNGGSDARSDERGQGRARHRGDDARRRGVAHRRVPSDGRRRCAHDPGAHAVRPRRRERHRLRSDARGARLPLRAPGVARHGRVRRLAQLLRRGARRARTPPTGSSSSRGSTGASAPTAGATWATRSGRSRRRVRRT